MDKKIVMIIAHKNFRDEELLETKKVFEDAGCTVKIASTDTVPARGMFGAFVKPDMTLDRVVVNNYEAVIFVGGSGSEVYFNNPTAHLLAREGYEKKKVLGAICIAPCILANAGILRGKNVTVWNGKYMLLLEKKGAKYTGRNVEVDGKIVTANGPEAAEEFGKAILKLLE